jgi:hypothetical protein
MRFAQPLMDHLSTAQLPHDLGFASHRHPPSPFATYAQPERAAIAKGRSSSLGHKDAAATMIYTHALNKPGLSVRSPLYAAKPAPHKRLKNRDRRNCFARFSLGLGSHVI